MKKKTLEAIATLTGTVIGAGILGIPYVVAKAGFIAGVINIILVGLLCMIINLLIGEVTLRTREIHQLSGYAEKYLGRKGKFLMAASMMIFLYGAMIAYIIGSGQALASITGLSSMICSVLIFLIISALIFFGLKAIDKAEDFAVPIIILFVLGLTIISIVNIRFENLLTFDITNVFIPYGVVLFSFIGSFVIPEIREELQDNRKELKKAIIIGSLIPLVLYVLFSLAIVGILGSTTSQIGTLGLKTALGDAVGVLGIIFSLFTILTSFLAVGLALKESFIFDYKKSNLKAWLLTILIPFIAFLFIREVADFINVINYTGVISGSIMNLMIIVLAMKAKKHGKRRPEYNIPINLAGAGIIIILLLLGAVSVLF
jgi:tyrosine-specific transport protein